MKPTKIINAKLDERYDVRFTLEFIEDEQGNEYGILTAPYVGWITLDEPGVRENVHEIAGELLQCIEKQYFDNNVITIPVKGCPSGLEIGEIINIYSQMICGTYKAADDADKSMDKFLNEFFPELMQNINGTNVGILKPRQPEFANRVFKDEDGTPYQGQRVIVLLDPDPDSLSGLLHIKVEYRNGKLHGDPAIVYPDGLEETWEDGAFVKIKSLPYARR